MKNLELIEKGWLEIEGVKSGNDLMSIANSIGHVIPHPNGDLMEIITPKCGANLTKGSFSQRFGYSSFPLHTDTSFWSKPARFIVLGMLNKSKCDSYVLNIKAVLGTLSDKALKSMDCATYLIETVEGKKYTSLLFKENKINGFKFDLSCMIPINKSAKYFHNEFVEALIDQKIEPIHWTGNKAVIIDNWNVMHGRKEVSITERERKLMRIYTE